MFLPAVCRSALALSKCKANDTHLALLNLRAKADGRGRAPPPSEGAAQAPQPRRNDEKDRCNEKVEPYSADG
jgi:hypothetical protein